MKRAEIFLPFRIDLKSGAPISDQVVYAVEKAIISGLLRPGDRFPSIRALSQDLRIHPNTTQKAVGLLTTCIQTPIELPVPNIEGGTYRKPV
jgi:DNA-binding transcriptional MocR family regulator